MEHFYHCSDLTPLTSEECLFINGGKEGDALHDLSVFFGRVCGYVDGVLDKLEENIQHFFDRVEEEWEFLIN